ncbi:E3 ubiquitin-protein ligase Praja-2 isoform X3 [Balearica regulorum gibbericeps]|uniref:E3 ubiquitin-protein ligase Praja-2 isoform X3 n=2 Tax=Balearica regulorum gibbericeps TaxID=100784 RepID=UPI000532583B|nr:PREDICTED: E3 ubiquitin-protein ligase Praja-2 [Balearica regulorum gibbericeps]
MGQEAGKPAWPRPAGGYQTITGRRYGRRHAYIGFRPSLTSQDRDEHQHNEDCERLELEDAQKENSLCSSPLIPASSGLLDEPLLENTGTEEPIGQNVSSETFEANTSPLSPFSYGLEDNQISGNFMNPSENSEDLAGCASGGHNDLNGQNGIAFVNIDSYEPDSSGGEEDAQDKFSLSGEEASVFQEALDNIFSELEKGVESFTDLQARLSALSHSVSRECYEEAGPMPLMRYFGIDSDLACPNNRTFKSSAEDQAVLKSNPNGANYETQQMKDIVDVGIRTPVAVANELNVSGGNTDQGNSPELVVRPKIRKQNTANQLEGEMLFPNDDEEESSWNRNGIAEVQQGRAECALRNSKEEMSSTMFFNSREYDGHQRNTEADIKKNATAQEEKNVPDDSTFWDEFEDCSRHFSMSHKDEDSSECSDGEWSTAVPTYFAATEKDQSSSDESWETVPAREECEPEVLSSSSGVEEENTDLSFQGGEQTLLEEGEIPWLQYHEEVESSTDEENDAIGDFVHPGFFLLDGNNNLEDDSSVSEDLDVEWRLLDEFGDGLGLAQAIPYVDPQFVTFMALEGRLQQAMEAALAQLEALGFDVEQAHPPATTETIDSLPHIIITDDHDGQEQCCTICCSEYVKDEIITELPCHHLFHKPCITLWLQKSGTCPVCRHVLEPLLPETAAGPVSFLSDYDSSSSVHNATEASN